jgi:hypothetical protein
MHDYKLLLRCDLYINMCIAHAKFFFLFHTREPLSTNRFSFKTSVTGQIVPANRSNRPASRYKPVELLISFRIYCSRYYCSATLLYSTNTDNSIYCLVSILVSNPNLHLGGERQLWEMRVQEGRAPRREQKWGNHGETMVIGFEAALIRY